jgi:putative zinc finger protein
MILSCREATRLASQGLDRQMSFGERLRLRVHLAICSGCANFSRQIALVRRAVQRLAS